MWEGFPLHSVLFKVMIIGDKVIIINDNISKYQVTMLSQRMKQEWTKAHSDKKTNCIEGWTIAYECCTTAVNLDGLKLTYPPGRVKITDISQKNPKKVES